MIRLLRRVRRHLGVVVEVSAYGFWLLVDIAAHLVDGGPPLTLLTAVAVPLVVLLRWRPGIRLVPVAAAAMGVSLAVSLCSTAPVATLLGATGPVTMLAFSEQLALAVVVAAVLRRCTLLRTGLALALLAAAAIVGSPLLRMTEPIVRDVAVLSALGWGGAVAIGLILREIDARRRAALADVLAAERMELARELHDVVAHHVTGIVVAAQAAAVVARTSPDDVDRALTAIEHAGTDALTAMRRMVGVLRGQHPTGPGEDGGARTPGADLREVRGLVERFDPDGRLVRYRADPGLEHAVLPPGVAATGYRVVQEALTNIRRHAPQAAIVDVDVRIREEALLVSVSNDGVPPGPGAARSGDGFGLVGMNERVAVLGGTLAAGPAAAGTWTVCARLPLRSAR